MRVSSMPVNTGGCASYRCLQGNNNLSRKNVIFFCNTSSALRARSWLMVLEAFTHHTHHGSTKSSWGAGDGRPLCLPWVRVYPRRRHLVPFMRIIRAMCSSGTAQADDWGSLFLPGGALGSSACSHCGGHEHRRTPMRQGTGRGYEPMQHAGGRDGCASLQIVCAWCQQPLRRQRVQTPTRFTISYSICARCYGDVSRESADSTGSTASRPCVPADRVEGVARHIPEKRRGKSFLSLLTEDIQQHAKDICLKAMVAQQTSQARIQTSQIARHVRQADRVERALWRDHIRHARAMEKLRLRSIASP